MRPMILAACSTMAIAFATSAIARSQVANTPARPPTVDDLLAFRIASDPTISPDGRWIAYVVTSSDREKNVNNAVIWVVPATGGTPFQLTRGPRVDRAPQWSPDGKWLAFLSDRSENRRMQVYGITPNGGESWQVTSADEPVTSFRISPDGRRIAYVAAAKTTKADEELEKERGRPIVRDSAYASEWALLWVAPLTDRVAGTPQRSSSGQLDVTSLAWAPDSRRLVWSAKPSPVLRYNSLAAIYLQDEPGALARKLSDMPGNETVADWSPDLGIVAAASANSLGTYNRKLWIIPDAGGTPTSLTDRLDEDASYVAANATSLFVEVPFRTGRGLVRIRLVGGKANGTPERVSDTTRFYSGFSATPDGSVVSFLAESPREPADVYVSPMNRFVPRRLTTINPQAASLALGEQRVVRWKSAADGESIEGILNLPLGYRAGMRVPLLLVIHGGPSGVSSNRYPSVRGAYPIPVFNALGYATLQPNYRGSAGYGERFRGLNRGHISGEDWIDVNSGVDYLISQGIADSARLGIMGWSFGGHHTYWGITHTPRFRAASAGAGATDLISMYSQTDLPDFYETYLGPRPWEDFKLYESRSAYRFVSRVVTPLLIQVGQADRRVPAEQSIEFYEAMKGIGKTPVTLVMYPGQPHGISDPRLQRDLMRRNVEWFTRWIPTIAGQRAQR